MAKPIIRTLQLELGDNTFFLTYEIGKKRRLTMSYCGTNHRLEHTEYREIVDFLMDLRHVEGPIEEAEAAEKPIDIGRELNKEADPDPDVGF